MKTKESLEKSMQAAQKQSHKLAKKLGSLLNKETLDAYPAEVTMPEIRETLNELNQRVHEYNAYRNALETV